MFRNYTKPLLIKEKAYQKSIGNKIKWKFVWKHIQVPKKCALDFPISSYF